MLNQQTALTPASRKTTAVKGALWVLFLYFAAKVGYLALQIRENIFPDEATWFGVTKVFSRSLLFPADSPESFPLGLITHVPNLYFFVMGKILPINIFGISDLIFLRGVNALLGCLTIYYGWKLICFLSESSSVRVLFVIMLTNTAMFTFMFGAVSYDNLTSLLSVLSLYYYLRFLKQRGPRNFLFAGIYMLAGLLTKLVLLPFVFALICLAGIHERKNIGAFPGAAMQFFSEKKPINFILLLLFILLLGLNVKLHVGNKLQFGSLVVTMEKVLPVEDCLKNRLFARDFAVRQFKLGKLTLLEAQRGALQIRDPGDRSFAWEMLEKAKLEKEDKGSQVRMGRLPYTVEWVKYIFTRTYSIAGHLVLSKSDKALLPYYAVFALGAILFLCRFRLGSMGGLAMYLAAVCAFYLVVLSQVVNYTSYLATGFVGFALTGRYIFPVLVPLYALLSYSLMNKMPRWWQWSAGIAISGIFILGEFPWFMKNSTPAWFF